MFGFYSFSGGSFSDLTSNTFILSVSDSVSFTEAMSSPIDIAGTGTDSFSFSDSLLNGFFNDASDSLVLVEAVDSVNVQSETVFDTLAFVVFPENTLALYGWTVIPTPNLPWSNIPTVSSATWTSIPVSSTPWTTIPVG